MMHKINTVLLRRHLGCHRGHCGSSRSYHRLLCWRWWLGYLFMYDLRASPRSCLHSRRSWRVAGRWIEPWKLSMKIFFKSSHEWIESCLKLSSHVSWVDSRAIGKYMTLVEFVPPATLIAVEYIRSHCLGSCLPSYFFRFCMFTGLKPIGYSA